MDAALQRLNSCVSTPGGLGFDNEKCFLLCNNLKTVEAGSSRCETRIFRWKGCNCSQMLAKIVITGKVREE